MTISDFLKLPNFTDLRLLAGKYGLLSEVTNVTVVDTPDGTNWLNGGELVITTAYMLHEEKDLLEFLRTLSSKKAAGVGIKENRYLTEIPESARKLADELHLPLISVPEAYPFVDIINPVLTQIINQQSFLLTQANMIHKEFLSLAINKIYSISSFYNICTQSIQIADRYLRLRTFQCKRKFRKIFLILLSDNFTGRHPAPVCSVLNILH